MPRRRSGFSLIELLIVVAIIAALVGVAVPFFQNNIDEANRAKAGQDLEQIRNALNRYYYDNKGWLLGTSLDPLLGRYMQEIPADPWGNPYLFDGAMGILLTYGADALPEGSGGDADMVRRLIGPAEIQRAQYQGRWGPPRCERDSSGACTFSDHRKGNAFVITLTKPVDEVFPDEVSMLIQLLLNVDDPAGQGAPIPIQDAGWSGPATGDPWAPDTWHSADATAFVPAGYDPRHRPETGVLVMRCLTNMQVSGAQPVSPTMALDFLPSIASQDAIIRESFYADYDPASPMDPAVYGTEAYELYKSVMQSSKPVNGQRQGVRLERY